MPDGDLYNALKLVIQFTGKIIFEVTQIFHPFPSVYSSHCLTS